MSLIKEMYISRFQNGIILNGDLAQIEMILLGQLSGDKNLLKLLNSGVDIHKYMYNRVYGTPIDQITKEMRSNIKAIDFGINYGKSSRSLSVATGLSVEECQDIINEFYDAFPMVKVWQDSNINAVSKNGILRLRTGGFFKFNKYVYIDNKKVLYKPEVHDPMRLRADYARPDIKNYPVQHTAGLIMYLILGQFFREYAVNNRKNYLLINTVHDSLMLDCFNEEQAESAQEQIQAIVDNIPDMMYNKFKIRMSTKVKMDFNRGKSWAELK